MTETPQGLLLLDKPSGVTSFDCVAVVRKKLGVQRVGHCGTLDPAARGLLLVLVGAATSSQDSFLGLEKEYWFTAELGRRTSTGDREGKMTETKPWGHVTKDALEESLRRFTGDIQQVPPMYSALKHRGKPYYEYARKGLSVPRAPRTVTIRAFSLISFHPPAWEARVVCSRGTYVRTLVEDVSESLKTCGTLTDLVRERIGPYHKDQALTWPELQMISREDLSPLLQPVLAREAAAHA